MDGEDGLPQDGRHGGPRGHAGDGRRHFALESAGPGFLVDSLQSQTRTSFTNFVSNIFKFIVNDYGLETLSKLSTNENNYELLLNLIDYSSFAVDDNTEDDTPTPQGIIQLTNHYSCIPQTPLYYLFQQRIKTLADDIKQTLQFKHQGLNIQLLIFLFNFISF